MMNTHRKVFCMFLGFLLVVSSCGEHITGHCQNLSYKNSLPPDMRENYHPTLTPIADFTGECYCHVEDAAIVAVMAPGLAVYVGIVFVATVAGPELVVDGLDALVN